MRFKFNLEAERESIENALKDKSLNSKDYLIYKEETNEIKNKIKSILDITDKYDGTKEIKIKHKDIIKDWFPESNCHIFMSHSHKDRDLAIKIANYLYTNYKIKTFIDSDYWQYVDEAIKEINLEHSRLPKPNNKNLKYESCLKVGTNFYLTLSNALMDEIDKSDCCLFLNTNNSIVSTKNNEEVTYSPWIYTELNILDKIRERPHKDISILLQEEVAGLECLEKSKLALESNTVDVEYLVDPSIKMPTIKSKTLIEILTNPAAVIPKANLIDSNHGKTSNKVKAIRNLNALYYFILA